MLIKRNTLQSKTKNIAKVSWKIVCCVSIFGTIGLLSKYSNEASYLRNLRNEENDYQTKMTNFNASTFKMFLKFMNSTSNHNTISEDIDYSQSNPEENVEDSTKKETCRPEPAKDELSKCGSRIAERKCCEYILSMKYKNELLDRYNCISDGYYVINGRKAAYREFPHMAAVGFNRRTYTNNKNENYGFFCGGALISDRFVLTAAHCTRLSGSLAATYCRIPYLVRLGVENIIQGEGYEDYSIKDIIRHHKYHSPLLYYDAALLKLLVKVLFTATVHPACLSTDLFSRHKKANVTGWGTTEFDTRSDHLLVATVSVIQDSDCSNQIGPLVSRKFKKLKKHQLCAGSIKDRSDTCQGDSGGPLQVKINTTVGNIHRVLGITSIGFKCSMGVPSIYTRVSAILTWIEKIVWRTYKNDHFEGFDSDYLDEEDYSLGTQSSILNKCV